ncbi:DUF4389 domain-containing protein [Halioxenophilus aromaticivorans]|uniref:DUF4389 domain-containing protein n=1 Tax=Halioxenophilus aromaticivorans TaxID=1306992 RepID=A0AAV3UA48_9ALTE
MTEKPYQWNSQAFWLRVVYMLVVALVAHLALMVIWFLLVLQFVIVLITGEPSNTLQRFSRTIGLFVAQAFAFIGFAQEKKPFPFSDWPQ